MRLLVIGDIGGFESYHVGDEAMLCANLDAVRRLDPEARFTLVSRDPAFSAGHHGAQAVLPFGFDAEPGAVESRTKLWDDVLDAARKLRGGAAPAAGTRVGELLATLGGCDGLLVSGGGNLCSTWPGHLHERAALLAAAAVLEKPAAVTGQTLGPHLTRAERNLLRETLPSARIVGCRERPSYALARELGVPADRAFHQLDDAMLLEPSPPDPEQQRRLAAIPSPRIIVNFTRSVLGAGVTQVARQLELLAETTGAHLLFVPHVNDPEGGDAAAGGQIRAALRDPQRMTVLDAWDARRSRWLSARAEMSLGVRYHPIVFGQAAGVPALGLWSDRYTRIKLEGALGHFGLEGWCLSLESALRGNLLPAALDLWEKRQEIRGFLVSCRADLERAERQRVGRIAQALALPPPSGEEATWRDLTAPPGAVPRRPGLLSRIRRGAGWSFAFSGR